jgi:hypothetical protein
MQYVADPIFQWLLVAVSYLMAEPNMRGIVQNLAATSLWEFARLACRAFRFWKVNGSRPARVASPQGRDGAESLTTVMLAAINTLSDRSGEITIKTQRSRYEKTELTIKLTDETRRVTSISMPVAKRVTRSQRQRTQDRMLFD